MFVFSLEIGLEFVGWHLFRNLVLLCTWEMFVSMSCKKLGWSGEYVTTWNPEKVSWKIDCSTNTKYNSLNQYKIPIVNRPLIKFGSGKEEIKKQDYIENLWMKFLEQNLTFHLIVLKFSLRTKSLYIPLKVWPPVGSSLFFYPWNWTGGT